MGKRIYDRFGFDKEGYNKDGYDRMGYNREGYDRQGFNKQGINKKGINKLTGYDAEGYDCEGYNKDGYNRDGFDRNGYDCEGYNQKGYNVDGYDRQGYDKKGYDYEGYNIYGYDCEGYDREGYGRYGFNREGYDREGFNRQGYNQEGYDREGYDYYGYDVNGFDKTGYDREGYDRQGYNLAGYNREGYDRNGYDKEGYDKDGYDVNLFNREHIYINGYNLLGVDLSGIDILGYDKDGFDVNGISIDGYAREMFDEEGYHIFTGFNIKGYDRDGFNINGYDEEGYDRDGYHSLTGLNRLGFTIDGYSRSGYDEEGYDRDGFNIKGYNRQGYNQEGFNQDGYDCNGYDKEGYNAQGYDINGYDRDGRPSSELQELNSGVDVDERENRMEAAYSKKCEYQIRTYFHDQVEKEVMKAYEPEERTYIDRWGFVQTDVFYPDLQGAKSTIKNRVNAVLREPYFAHVDYKDNSELYIGKQAVHGWVTDWADKRASLYYQYQMYIGNEAIGLNYVRDIIFKRSKYAGYSDKYNSEESFKNIDKIADTHLAQIIAANQSSKKIHDIIETIQKNQYQIIVADKEIPLLLLGCAGSGKTMILMHKIRFMKYNDTSLQMSDVIVISPTDILGRESRELSKLLQIENMQQFTSDSFYKGCCLSLFIKSMIPYEEFSVIDEMENELRCFDCVILDAAVDQLNYSLTNPDYFDQQKRKINQMVKAYVDLFGKNKKYVDEMHGHYVASKKEIAKASWQEIESLIYQIDHRLEELEILEDTIEILSILKNWNIFRSHKSISDNKAERSFVHTREMILNLNRIDFIRCMKAKKINIDNPFVGIQILQRFMRIALELDAALKLQEEWLNISVKTVDTYIEMLMADVEAYNHLSRKKEVLQILLNDENLNARLKKKHSKSNMHYLTAFDRLVELYDGSEDILENIGYTPIRYFQEYDKLDRRKKRLEMHKKVPRQRAYLFDAILEKLEIEYTLNSEISVSKSKLFAMLYMIQKFVGKITDEKKYVFIDEFQDFAPIEFMLIKNLYPQAVINLFGDVRQCINHKGIKTIHDIPQGMYNKLYEIEENYRNARQITDYVNEKFALNMLPVGLNGKVSTVSEIPIIPISDDDRVAIIIPNFSEYNIKSIPIHKINYFCNNREIIRGMYNIIPISLSKGLEFEKVIVVKESMTPNEFYVACTRAISELYVVEEDEEKTDTASENMRSADTEIYSGTDKMEQQAEDVNLSGYSLIPYEGKLKKLIGQKHVPQTFVTIYVGEIEKKILINYVADTKCAYVRSILFNMFKQQLSDLFLVVEP